MLQLSPRPTYTGTHDPVRNNRGGLGLPGRCSTTLDLCCEILLTLTQSVIQNQKSICVPQGNLDRREPALSFAF